MSGVGSVRMSKVEKARMSEVWSGRMSEVGSVRAFISTRLAGASSTDFRGARFRLGQLERLRGTWAP